MTDLDPLDADPDVARCRGWCHTRAGRGLAAARRAAQEACDRDEPTDAEEAAERDRAEADCAELGDTALWTRGR